MKKKIVAIMACAMMLLSVGASAEMTAGTYTGEGQGIGGAVKVAVTVEGGAITAVEVVEHAETAGICDPAIEKIPAAIVAAQSLAVDTVTGATVTSNAVKEALAKALAEAKGEAVANDAAVAFTAGTYTGTAKGYNGPVEVAVTFSDSAVTAIEVGANKETDHVGNVAFEPVIADILAANGTGVDGVSGATLTSGRIKDAAVKCLTQAAQ